MTAFDPTPHVPFDPQIALKGFQDAQRMAVDQCAELVAFVTDAHVESARASKVPVLVSLAEANAAMSRAATDAYMRSFRDRPREGEAAAGAGVDVEGVRRSAIADAAALRRGLIDADGALDPPTPLFLPVVEAASMSMSSTPRDAHADGAAVRWYESHGDGAEG
ncbi:MAG TPA: hypothetical protein VI318_21285 [Baekduia sp.]